MSGPPCPQVVRSGLALRSDEAARAGADEPVRDRQEAALVPVRQQHDAPLAPPAPRRRLHGPCVPRVPPDIISSIVCLYNDARANSA